MDDLQGKISQILSDPEAMEQLQSLGQMLGLNPAQASQKQSAAPTGFASPNPPAKPPEIPFMPPPEKGNLGFDLQSFANADTLKIISKVMPVLSKIKQDDDVSRLLDALRPFLSEQRRHKLDEAKKMIQMMKLLPLIKDVGLF